MMEPRAPIDHPEFRPLLRNFGVDQVSDGSVFADSSESAIRGWRVALDRASRLAERLPTATREWLREGLASLASRPANAAQRSLAAEVEAGLRLSWLGPVERVPETPKSPTADFRVEALHVEVFCPQEHTIEKQVVEADLAQQLARATGPVQVAVAISHPTTGSGRKVNQAGDIERDPKNKALQFPANKLIDRILHAKRDARQFRELEQNVLWLDLKHGIGMRALDCLPFRSEVAKGTCYVGTHGVWHAFYGESGSPHFDERTTLEWQDPSTGYEQHCQGWFRDARKVSAAILSALDGVIVFENPWAKVPLTAALRADLFRLSELRPEFCWINCAGTLETEVNATLAKLSWLARLAGVRFDDLPDPSMREAFIDADKP